MERVFSLVKEYGIQTYSFNILGMPFETPQMSKDTFNLNWKLRPDFGTSTFFYPYPGSKLHQMCADFGLMEDDIGSISGYLEKPALRETHFKHKDIIQHKQALDVLFLSRLVCSKLKLPLPIENIFMRTLILFRRPLLVVLNRSSDNRLIRGFVKTLRRFALKYMR
jgi:hypothetical protein